MQVLLSITHPAAWWQPMQGGTGFWDMLAASGVASVPGRGAGHVWLLPLAWHCLWTSPDAERAALLIDKPKERSGAAGP